MEPSSIRTSFALGRSLDLRFASNRAIAILIVASWWVGFLNWWLLGRSAGIAALDALRVAGTVFLAWAIGREADPDRNASAFVAVPFAVAGSFVLGSPDLVLLLWILLAVRLVNRTVGKAASWGDDAVLAILAAFLVWRGYGSVGWVTAAALAVDAALPLPRKVHLVGAGIVVAAMVPLWILHRPVLPPPDSLAVLGGGWRWGVVAVAIASLPGIVASHRVTSVGDEDLEPLSGHRVAAAQLLAVAGALVAVVVDGVETIALLGPLWAAVAGAIPIRVFGTIRGSRYRSGIA
ncbi:hypothetical protein JW848_00420 [Candidatus Bipolaricaulota bacterium]|nr:hypothetical protein [Candidatus Bipolaricaulota bacterium]